jgi:NDP-4-keto-2,6-dideoxyhexose 3-C-methyltransferase
MIQNCRLCGSKELTSVVDLGEQHLSDFRNDQIKPPKFPLHLLLCQKCNLAQLADTVDRNLMYHDGYGYMSGINEIIVRNLQMLVNYALSFIPQPGSWLDIACNDGTLLSMVPNHIYKVGVDPVSKFKTLSSQNANLIIDDFFPSEKTRELKDFEVITSISMFYDIDDPNLFVNEVKNKLAKNGIWVIQQNYLLSMLENNSFDNICHEHIEYYSLRAMKHLMEANDLEIFDVQLDDINGGSLITAVAHTGTREVQPSVKNQIEKEFGFGLSTSEPYRNFGNRITAIKNTLIELLNNAKKNNKRVQIYGASTRGATIWQFIGISKDLVESAVERQEGKIGKNFSAIQIPIIGEKEMRLNPPDFLLVGPWFLKQSFVEREKDFTENGGKFIFPLPNVEIVPSSDQSM